MARKKRRLARRPRPETRAASSKSQETVESSSADDSPAEAQEESADPEPVDGATDSDDSTQEDSEEAPESSAEQEDAQNDALVQDDDLEQADSEGASADGGEAQESDADVVAELDESSSDSDELLSQGDGEQDASEDGSEGTHESAIAEGEADADAPVGGETEDDPVEEQDETGAPDEPDAGASEEEANADNEDGVERPILREVTDLDDADDDVDQESGAQSSPGLMGEGVEVDESEVEDTEQFLKGLVEAILFSSDKPQTAKDVARAARIDKRRAQELIELLIEDTKDRGVRLCAVSEGYGFRTNPAYSSYVREYLAQRPVRLSRAQLETLAIIAYRQPLTRPEVDDIRGVDSGAVIKLLLERELIRILGKKDEPGRPMIYGTTPGFLDLFSLTSLRDLPTLREFTELSDDSRAKFELEIGEPAPEGQIEFPEESESEGDDESVSDEPPEEAAIDPALYEQDGTAEEEDLAVDEPEGLADDEEDLAVDEPDGSSDDEEDLSVDEPEDSDEDSADEGDERSAGTSDAADEEDDGPALSAEDEEEFPDDDDDDDDDEDDDDDDDDD